MVLDPGRPHEYPRRVLVCVVGMSPAVVTETLYALAKKEEPAFVPTEVHVVTTTKGAEGVRDRLLAGGNGAFHELLTEHLPGVAVAFSEDHIHLVRDGECELPDIVTKRHQVAVADTLLHVLRELAADHRCAIHASIAGGRKTMSFYMGYAMSLLGRPQDRMSHVLLTRPGFEHVDFFFPTKDSKPLLPKEVPPPKALVLDAKDADGCIELAPVSFVRLGDGAADWLRETKLSFNDAVAFAQLAVTPQPVTLDLASCTVSTGGRSARLEPKCMAWYAYFALRRLEGLQPDRLPFEGAVRIQPAFEGCVGLDMTLLRQVFNACGIAAVPKFEETHASDKDTDLAQEFREVPSIINAKLKAAFGPQAARRLSLAGPGERHKRDGVYGLMNLAPEHIVFTRRPDAR